MVQVLQVEAWLELKASVQILLSRRSKRLEDVLVFHLVVKSRVLVDLFALLGAHQVSDALLNLADLLRLGETMIKHLLVVANQVHLAFESRSPVVLRLRKSIVLLLKGGTH